MLVTYAIGSAGRHPDRLSRQDASGHADVRGAGAAGRGGRAPRRVPRAAPRGRRRSAGRCAEQLHVTLAFLAEVPDRNLDDLVERLGAGRGAAYRRSTTRIAGGGAFPNAGRRPGALGRPRPRRAAAAPSSTGWRPAPGPPRARRGSRSTASGSGRTSPWPGSAARTEVTQLGAAARRLRRPAPGRRPSRRWSRRTSARGRAAGPATRSSTTLPVGCARRPTDVRRLSADGDLAVGCAA